MKKSVLKKTLVFLLAFVLLTSLTACEPVEEEAEKRHLVMGNCGWESMHFNAHVAGIILQEGYGYTYEVLLGATPVLLEGMVQGDVHILTEAWTENYGEAYSDLVDSGDILDLGVNFVSDQEGLFVPTYVIEGDAERGIEPMAPGLKSALDLPEYWELFKDPEDSSKGRIVGPPPTWFVAELMDDQIKTYGLDEWYNHFLPGSDMALATAMVDAYDKGEPVVAYHWAPDWVLGLGDWTLLDEPPYDPELWEDGYGCKRKPQDVTKAVAKDMPEWGPEIVEFLEKMVISVDIHNEMLAYMETSDAEADEAALHFLNEYPDLWAEWLPEEVAEKVKEAL